MDMISAFITVDKTAHNSRKFAFTLSLTNYGYWKTLIEPFLITNNLMGYVDGSIPCPLKTLSVTDGATVPKKNPNYPIWVSNDAHVRMLIISTISEASFCHVQCITSHDLWLSLEKVYAPHSTSREYTFKIQLLRIEMHSDETPDAYLNRSQEYVDALAAIGEPIKDKDLVMLAVSGLREEYNGLKTTITARQSPTAFSELHALLNTGANSHVTPDLEVVDNSEAYYGNDALNVGNGKGLPILHIGSSKVYSPQKTSKSDVYSTFKSLGATIPKENPNYPIWISNDAHVRMLIISTISEASFRHVQGLRGIGHIPSQCPNHDPSTIHTRPSANFANTRAQSSNASTNWHSDTGANSHVTPDLEAMDNSEAYYGDDALYVGNEISHNLLSV
ncbi:tryptophan synthase beta chain 1 [Tanacetum coccineum]